jgi:hypothetical protein
MSVFGLGISPSEFTPYRSVIGPPETSPNGNLILRVGREHANGGWQQTEHVVMQPDEARTFVQTILDVLS